MSDNHVDPRLAWTDSAISAINDPNTTNAGYARIAGKHSTAYTTLGTHYAMLRYLGEPIKLPRKLKKKYIWTRSRRRRMHLAHIRYVDRIRRQGHPDIIDITFYREEIVIRNADADAEPIII